MTGNKDQTIKCLENEVKNLRLHIQRATEKPFISDEEMVAVHQEATEDANIIWDSFVTQASEEDKQVGLIMVEMYYRVFHANMTSLINDHKCFVEKPKYPNNY